MEQNTINPQVGLPIDPQNQSNNAAQALQTPGNSTVVNQPETVTAVSTQIDNNSGGVPKKKISLILLISIILLICSIIVIAVFFLKEVVDTPISNNLKTNTPSPTSSSTGVLNKTPLPVSIEGWKIYTNNVLKYTIRYPSDWSIDVSKAELPVNGNNVQEIYIYKDSYKLTITWPTAYGPTICYFDDQIDGQMISGGNFCKGGFVEYNGDNDLITYRRLNSPTPKSDMQSWTVFTKSKNYFVGLPPIIMIAPKVYSEEEVSIMDKMLSTLTYIEAYPYFAGTEATTSSGSN